MLAFLSFLTPYLPALVIMIIMLGILVLVFAFLYMRWTKRKFREIQYFIEQVMQNSRKSAGTTVNHGQTFTGSTIKPKRKFKPIDWEY